MKILNYIFIIPLLYSSLCNGQISTHKNLDASCYHLCYIADTPSLKKITEEEVNHLDTSIYANLIDNFERYCYYSYCKTGKDSTIDTIRLLNFIEIEVVLVDIYWTPFNKVLYKYISPNLEPFEHHINDFKDRSFSAVILLQESKFNRLLDAYNKKQLIILCARQFYKERGNKIFTGLNFLDEMNNFSNLLKIRDESD